MMMDKQIKIEKRCICAYIGFFMLNIYYGFADTIFYDSFLNIFLLFSVASFLFQIVFYNRSHSKRLLPIILIVGVFVYNYWHQKDSRILVLIFAILSMKNCKIENLLKFLLFEKIVIFVFIVFISALGFDGFVTKGNEYILGYIHGNLFTLNVLEMVLIYLCLSWQKVSPAYNVTIFLIFLITFFITKSKTGILISLIVYCLFLAIKYTEKYHFIRPLSVILLPAMFVLSIVLPYSITAKYRGFYANKEWLYGLIQRLDGVLTNRLTLAALKFENTDIHMLDSVSVGDLSLYKYMVVDSGYVQLLLVFGFIGSALFILIYMFTIYKVGKLDISDQEKYSYLLCIIAMELYAFTENSLCSLKYNFTLLFVIFLIKGQKNNWKIRDLQKLLPIGKKTQRMERSKGGEKKNICNFLFKT